MPKVAVITPTYDGEAFIEKALSSVRQQTLTDWEHVVVDDGSRDGTRDLVAAACRNERRLRLLTQPNAGVAAARNRGLAAVSADTRYVLFLDQDDELLPCALDRLSGYLDCSPEVVAVFGNARRVDATGAPLSARPERPLQFRMRTAAGGRAVVRRTRDRRLTFADLILTNPIPTPGMCLIRRSVLDTIGGFDPNVAPCDDWDLWLRLALAAGIDRARIHRVPDMVLLWRRHDANLSRRASLMRLQRLRVYEKFLRLAETERLARLAAPFGQYGLDTIFWSRLTRRAFAGRHLRDGLIFLLRATRAKAAGFLLQARLRRSDAVIRRPHKRVTTCESA